MFEEIDTIKKYIKEREPIFHNRNITNNREDLEKEVHKNFFEIGASGKIYTREFVLDSLEERYKNNTVDVMVEENWKILEFDVKNIENDMYMSTYILDGQIVNGKNRKTRRTTLWRGNLKDGFKILFHQGTVIE